MITIFDCQESLLAKVRERQKFNKEEHVDGFYAGDGETWIKCVDHEAAVASRLKYIFFVKGLILMLYQA